ncbi:MAG: bifunctional 5,10-methylene-tetrahydrofolate dehydrogenase/5,10-methylene-tetrahydrofolate cyclohydrolase [Treponema sp.]|jgi:methylenetetrahydrofolate dehydrogenase (NADP+)/methenyltetrahydrofolate cyclohydrolase|nr:bifunctional 5,10-methylene-tetrahydrofolate dehydrogenase/5,10-methylene-tetrahydrofolate cyclohydrolase [Treponema sp.]
MAAIIIDGKKTAEKVRDRLKLRTNKLKDRGIIPCLAVILVGENPASVSYVTGKKKALAETGMEDRDLRLPAETTEAELLAVIASLNADTKVHGILVQLPLPSHIDENKVICAIDPAKDVDGFHPVSMGNLILEKPGFIPCTPMGIIHLLKAKEWEIPVAGKNVVIVGRSNIVGKPMANLLIRREHNATVTICHTGTSDLSHFTRQADILIAAAGRPGLITADMVKAGAAVIDVGVNRITDASKKKGFRLEGDTDYDGLIEKAGWITPVPGGVGPMTIAMLMQNVVLAAEQKGD